MPSERSWSKKRREPATGTKPSTSTGTKSNNPTQYHSQNRPLTQASSSGSLTETPIKHSRRISTTITRADVEKWMEKGTYGTAGAQYWGLGQHGVDMTKNDVGGGQSQGVESSITHVVTEARDETSEKSDKTGVRADGSVVKSDTAGLLAEEEPRSADSIVADVRCDYCDGVIVWTKSGDYMMVCQQCKEPH